MQTNLNPIVNVPYLTIPLLSSLPLFSSPPLSFAELPIPALSAPWAPLCNKVIYYGVFSSGRVWLDLLIRSVKVEKILKDSLASMPSPLRKFKSWVGQFARGVKAKHF